MSLRLKFFPFLARACPEPDEGKGARGMVERVFPHSVSRGDMPDTSCRRRQKARPAYPPGMIDAVAVSMMSTRGAG